MHTRFRNRSADCRPVRWRTPLQPRSCNYGELTPPALGRSSVCAPQKSQLCRQTFTQHQERRASARPDCGSDSATTIHQTFAPRHRAREQDRRASACRGCGYRDCDAVRRCSVGSLSHMGHRHCQRVTVIHGGLRPPLLVVPAFVYRKSRNFFGKHSRSIRSGGRQPTVVLETYLHTRFRNCSADCRRCVGARRCNRARGTTGDSRPRSWSRVSGGAVRTCAESSWQARFPNHGGLTPPPLLFRRRSPAEEIATFTMYKRTCTGAAGVSPPWFWRRTCTRASPIVRQTVAGALAHAVAIAFV